MYYPEPHYRLPPAKCFLFVGGGGGGGGGGAEEGGARAHVPASSRKLIEREFKAENWLIQSVFNAQAKHFVMEIPEVEYKPSPLILKPMEVPVRLLLGPGPSNPHPRVQRASGTQLVGHLHPEFYAIMDEIQAGLKYAFQTENSLTLAVDGSGHAAMEAAIVNVVEPGEKVLILENGIWGERAREIAERCGEEKSCMNHSPLFPFACASSCPVPH